MEGVWVRVKEGAATYGYVMAGDGTCNDCRLGEEKMLCVSGISIWQRQHGLGWSYRGRRGEPWRASLVYGGIGEVVVFPI